MATRRSSVFDNVDPGLVRAIEEVSRTYKKYRAQPFSGNRPRPKNPSSLHPRGRAIDVNLYDPETGKMLPNIGDPASASAYQDYANTVYKWALQNDPQLAKELQWGGYFAGGGWPQDYMHFQRGGNQPAGGSWEGGFTPAVMQKLGLKSSGGLGQMDAQMQAAGYTPEQRQAALLSVIRQMEGGGKYDVRYGGAQFDTSKGWAHPNVRQPIGGPGGDFSTAAGAYQYIKPTWDRLAKQYNLADFSPANQDIGAWKLAAEQFGGEEGLRKALEGDPLAVASKLGGQWEALKKNPKGFAEAYNKALGGDGTLRHVGGAGSGPGYFSGTSDDPAVASNDDYADAMRDALKDKKKSWRENMSEALLDAEFETSSGPGYNLPAQTLPGVAQAPATSMVNPQQVEQRRQQLALIMQRLNTGSLV